jgi:hypothetical protein
MSLPDHSGVEALDTTKIIVHRRRVSASPFTDLFARSPLKPFLSKHLTGGLQELSAGA